MICASSKSLRLHINSCTRSSLMNKHKGDFGLLFHFCLIEGPLQSATPPNAWQMHILFHEFHLIYNKRFPYFDIQFSKHPSQVKLMRWTNGVGNPSFFIHENDTLWQFYRWLTTSHVSFHWQEIPVEGAMAEVRSTAIYPNKRRGVDAT